MPITRRFTVYTNAGVSVPPVIHVNQYDRGETWIFTLLEPNGSQYIPASGGIVGIKADGHAIINTATVNGNGEVVVSETQQMTAAPGKAVYEIIFDNSTHGTANFIVCVEPKPGDNATLSDSDLSLIQEAIDSTIPANIADAVQDWMDDNLAPSQWVIDSTLSIAGAAADAKKTGDGLNELKTDIQQINELNDEKIIVYPINRFNTYSGVIPPSTASGTDTSSTSYSTTNFINAKYGDKIYCGFSNDRAQALTPYGAVYVTEYGGAGQWLYRSAQFPSVNDENGKPVYTVVSTGTKYIRVTFANVIVTTSGRVFQISININTSGYIYYSDYFTPYIKNRSADLKIIDCWGDSRTEMIAGVGTSYCDYLQSILGNTYNVCNYGESSQSSGMCAARLGSNEIFVTLTNNQIPASGEVNLTDIKCSSGNSRNVYAYSPSSYIPCMVNGVRGRLSRASIATYDNVKFLRDSAGSVINVHPRTKIEVPDMNSKNHICVFWWGKNDFASADTYVVSGILDNYDKAVKYIGHDQYVILGETCSINSSYENGGSNRIKMNEINNTLNTKYPNNFIDINAYLSSEQALTDVGLTPTATDLEYIENGFPCYQLMRYSTDTSDTVHPNEKGREAIAHKIHAWMSTKGWFQ